MVLLCFLLVLAAAAANPAASQWKPADSYAIDCGSSEGGTSTYSGKQWQGESNSSFVSGGVGVAAPGQNAELPASIPYITARVFESRSNYTFPIDPGRHWLRLHFYPFDAAGFDSSRANFSITVGSYELFTGDMVQAIKNSGAAYMIREYSVPTAGLKLLPVIFTPASNTSVAFVNGIELMSMPEDALKDDALLIGARVEQKFGLDKLAFQTMYRINVGGASVNVANDTQQRSWEPDQRFIEGAAAGSASTDAISSINFTSTVPEYIAPASVYGTSRQLGSANIVNSNFNISWRFRVDPSHVYYIRLHFAELKYEKTYQRMFNVYINNQTALEAFDLIALGPRFMPVYRDFAVAPVPIFTSIRLQIGSTPNSDTSDHEAILNGIEILKMNNTAGSLAESSLVATAADVVEKSNRSMTVGAIVGTSLGCMAAIAFLVGLGFLCCRKSKAGKILSPTWRPIPSQTGTSIVSVGSPRSLASSAPPNSCRHFTLQQILDATNNFDDALLLGVGGFGKVYKGETDGGLKVAVKRGNPRSEQGLAEFQTEIEMLSRLRHRHLVSLIGYCDENAEMILVYDYMANGPLRGHLYGTDLRPLSWKRRLEICIGAARGLHYLHTGAARAIIHRDVKTTNILLDDNFVAKVADFGLSKVGPTLEHTHVSTAVKGSFGYLDPEYFRRQQLTEKSDVYSFGVVLMEVLCARPAINPTLPREQVNIAEWALHWQKTGTLETIMDSRLEGDITQESLEKFGAIAESCLAERGSDRPSIGQVLWNLEYALQLHQASLHSTTINGNSNQVLELLPLRNHANDHPVVGESSTATSQVFSEVNNSTTASAVFSQLLNPEGR